MDLTHVIAFNLALFAAIASPGPALLVALRTTLSAGRRAGVAVGAGLALVASGWTLAALLGLEALFLFVPWAYTVAKIAGATYLLYVAWGMWRNAAEPIETQITPASNAFLQGLAINALNPKSVLFAAAVLVVIFPAGLSTAETALIVANHLAVELAFYSLLATALSRPMFRDRYLAAKYHIDRVAAGVLGLLGLRLLLGR